MRMFGLAGLLLALVIAGVVAKKQMASVAAPALPSAPGEAPADPHTQVQQVEKQIKEALDAAAQARKMPDDN